MLAMHLQEVDVAIVADVGTLQRLPTIVGQGLYYLPAPSIQANGKLAYGIRHHTKQPLSEDFSIAGILILVGIS